MNSENRQSHRTYDWLEDALLCVCRNAFPSETSLQIHSLKARLQRVSPHRDYEFVLQSPDAEVSLILRLHHGMFTVWGDPDRIKSAREYSAMLHAYQAGVCAPFPYGFTTSDQPFGKPYLLHDPGDGTRWWEMPESLRMVQGDLLDMLAEELAKLHYAVEPKHPLIPSVKVHAVVTRLWNRVSRFAPDDMRQCFEHCKRDLLTITPLPPVMLHGQYDFDHLLLKNGRIRTILDWEYAAFGDPRWDVAYTALSLQRNKDRSLANRFVARYVQLAEMPLENMEFWEGLVALKAWALSLWLCSLDNKSFLAMAGLQTPLVDSKESMRTRAMQQFG